MGVSVRGLCPAPADVGKDVFADVATAANEVELAFVDRGDSTTSLERQKNEPILDLLALRES